MDNWSFEFKSRKCCRNFNWKEIDSHTDVHSLPGPNKSDIFGIKTDLPQNEGYKYIRLKTTVKSIRGCNALTLNSLEYFGVLFQK